MTKIYRVVWSPNESVPDCGGYVEFLDSAEAERYRDNNYPHCDIIIVEKELFQIPQVEAPDSSPDTE